MIEPVFEMFILETVDLVKIIDVEANSIENGCLLNGLNLMIMLQVNIASAYTAIALALIEDANMLFLSPLSYESQALNLSEVDSILEEDWKASLPLLFVWFDSGLEPCVKFSDTVKVFFDPLEAVVKKNFDKSEDGLKRDSQNGMEIILRVATLSMRFATERGAEQKGDADFTTLCGSGGEWM